MKGLECNGLYNTARQLGELARSGERYARLPCHSSFCIKFIERESICLGLNFSAIAGMGGSTCSSEALKISHVLD